MYLTDEFLGLQNNSTDSNHNCIPDEHYIQTLLAVSSIFVSSVVCGYPKLDFSFLLGTVVYITFPSPHYLTSMMDSVRQS